MSIGSSRAYTNSFAADSALFLAFLISSSPLWMAFAALSISLTIDEICEFCITEFMAGILADVGSAEAYKGTIWLRSLLDV